MSKLDRLGWYAALIAVAGYLVVLADFGRAF